MQFAFENTLEVLVNIHQFNCNLSTANAYSSRTPGSFYPPFFEAGWMNIGLYHTRISKEDTALVWYMSHGVGVCNMGQSGWNGDLSQLSNDLVPDFAHFLWFNFLIYFSKISLMNYVFWWCRRPWIYHIFNYKTTKITDNPLIQTPFTKVHVSIRLTKLLSEPTHVLFRMRELL